MFKKFKIWFYMGLDRLLSKASRLVSFKLMDMRVIPDSMKSQMDEMDIALMELSMDEELTEGLDRESNARRARARQSGGSVIDELRSIMELEEERVRKEHT